MPTYDFKAQGSGMLSRLNWIQSLYTDKYLTIKSSQGTYTRQKQKLTDTLNSIQKQIDVKADVINTYDRELQDRNASKKPFTFWRLYGVSTLQDWVLFIFYIVYILLSIFLMIQAARTQAPIQNFFAALLSSIVLGVVIMGSIVRFA